VEREEPRFPLTFRLHVSCSLRNELVRASSEYRGYDVAIMLSRTQITLESDLHQRARRRTGELGVSLAEYVRRLVARDLARPEIPVSVDFIFDLGNSEGSDVAREKDSMVAEAFAQSRRRKASRH